MNHILPIDNIAQMQGIASLKDQLGMLKSYLLASNACNCIRNELLKYIHHYGGIYHWTSKNLRKNYHFS